jgi:hypothetical protein
VVIGANGDGYPAITVGTLIFTFRDRLYARPLRSGHPEDNVEVAVEDDGSVPGVAKIEKGYGSPN